MEIIKSNQVDILDAVGANVLTEFRSTKTRRERCDAQMVQVIEQPYDPSRKGERDARLKECMARIKEPLSRDYFDAVESELRKTYTDLVPMVNPLPAPDPMERIAPAAIRMGWHGLEIDILQGFVRQGRRVGRVSWKDVEVDGGLMSREEIRYLTRPAWTRQPGASFDEIKWKASWPPIREVKIDDHGDAYFVDRG